MDKYTFGNFPSAINLVLILNELDNKRVSKRVSNYIFGTRKDFALFRHSWRYFDLSLEEKGLCHYLLRSILLRHLERIQDYENRHPELPNNIFSHLKTTLNTIYNIQCRAYHV